MAEPQTIQKDSVVKFEYTLKNDAGKVLDKSEGGEPLAYLHGHGNIVPGLESALEGKKAGDSLDVKVPPADGYGEVDKDAIFAVPRDKLPPNLKLEKGLELASRTPDGHMFRFRVVEVREKEIVADANHPLAGENLNFSVKVVDVRPATQEELSHGHVHEGDGHHHHH
jgi:FKBP-type peptidyl-prolyl cis-trans isomerase SlyD